MNSKETDINSLKEFVLQIDINKQDTNKPRIISFFLKILRFNKIIVVHFKYEVYVRFS